MSNILLGTNPKNPKIIGQVNQAREGSSLPKPSGYHILCAIPAIDKEFTNSSIVKADKTLADEATLSTVLFVMSLGPDCYTDKDKFPTGPWCKEGDFIITRPYAGSRLDIFGTEMRLINDDSVEAVVENPVGIRRK